MMYFLSLCTLFATVRVLSIDDGNWRLLSNGNGKIVSLAKAWSQYKSEFGLHKMNDPSPAGVLKVCSGTSTSNCASEKLQNFRLTYFKKAYNYITEHNSNYHAGNSKYRLKITQFADLSMSELTSYTGGEHVGKPEGETRSDALDMSKVEDIPKGSSVDWRKTSKLEIHNQGQCGSCWAFASTAMIENRVYQSTGKYTELANQELVDCVSGCYGCMGGWSFKATEYVEYNGLAAESNYAYTAYDGSCYSSKYSRQISAGGISAQYQSASGESDMVKIVAYGAMTIALDVLYDFYFIADEVYAPEQDSCNWNNNLYVGAHAIAVVGYTDDYWIIQNSWGTGWGDSGYAYMVRGENVCNIGYWDNWSWISMGSSNQKESDVDNETTGEDEEISEEETLEEDGDSPAAGSGFWTTATIATVLCLGGSVLLAASVYAGYCLYKGWGYNTLNEPKEPSAVSQPEMVPPAQQKSELML